MSGVLQRPSVYDQYLLTPQVGPNTQQQTIENMLVKILVELSMNRFKWEGLPDEVDKRWLEYNLCINALVVYLRDKDFGHDFALAGSPAGNVNMVGNPTHFQVYGNPLYNRTLKAKDCVPIWANYLRIPDIDQIRIYAKRMAIMDRTIEINSLNARRTKIIAVTETKRGSLANIERQIEQGAAAISVTPNALGGDAITALDLGVDPQTVTNMHIARSRQWNEIMTLLGINNANQDKKERLVAAEVSGNDDMVATIRAVNLNARQIACEQINKKYGLDVSVDYVTDMVTATLQDTDPQQGAIPEGAES